MPEPLCIIYTSCGTTPHLRHEYVLHLVIHTRGPCDRVVTVRSLRAPSDPSRPGLLDALHDGLQHDASVGGPGLVAAALLEHRSHLVGIGQPRLRHAVLREQPPVLRALPLQRGVAAAEAADQAAEAESGRSRSGCLSATGPLINWITTFPRRSGAEATREAVRGLRLMALEQGAVP